MSAQPMAIMTSYNRVDGTYASANYDMNTDLLRGEWGFKGLVMTDWGGNHGAVATMYSGNDLIMPGNNPAEIIDATKKVAPTIDVAGLAVYTTTVRGTGLRYSWQFGGLTPSATGSASISTTVDATTNLSDPASGAFTTNAAGQQVFTPVSYASVADAYAATTSLLATSALSATQKAAITITDVTHATPGDDTSPITAYTVVVKGNYPTSYDMRLGDLQRSAMRILDVAMQSAPFDELASIQGVGGIAVGSYTTQFHNLQPVVTTTHGKVQ